MSNDPNISKPGSADPTAHKPRTVGMYDRAAQRLSPLYLIIIAIVILVIIAFVLFFVIGFKF